MLQRAFGYTPPSIPGARWIPAVFGTAVFLYGGRPFIQGAIRELRDRLRGMMTLITLAITAPSKRGACGTRTPALKNRSGRPSPDDRPTPKVAGPTPKRRLHHG
jgi:hypothetical protein